MKVRVIDLEATGTDKEKAAGIPVGICEIGYTDVHEDGTIVRPKSRLVNPRIPMPPAARGVHHIDDKMLADAVSPDVAFSELMTGMEPGDAFAAHNAAFERAFFGGGAHQWICTMICAKHLLPDAPDYKNQTLRYYLDLESEFEWPELTMPPHRAGPDSYVTAHILRSMLRTQGSIAGLVNVSATPIIQKNVPFGKYQGRPWSEMDRGFLEWVLDKDFNSEVKDTARYWLKELNSSAGRPFG